MLIGATFTEFFEDVFKNIFVTKEKSGDNLHQTH